MRVENNTIYIECKDMDVFFDTFEKSVSSFKKRQIGESDGEGLPKWVKKVQDHMEEHVFRFIHEAAVDSGYRQSYKAGYAMGVLRWSEGLINKQFERLAQYQFPKNCEVVSEVSDEEFGIRFDRMILDLLFGDTGEDKKQILKDSLRSIRNMYLHAPISEAADFFEGLADGFKGYDMRGGLYGRGNLSTPIMVTLFMQWPQVQKMQSVSQLHRWLQVTNGKAQVGELKRVEKICERIGLTFRKPGRPKKSKPANNSDTERKA